MALTKDDIINLPTWQKGLLLIGFILLLGVLWYLIVYSPTSQKITELKGDIKRLKEEIAVQKQAKARKEDLASQMVKLREELTILRSKLPEEKEIPMLLSRVNEIGRLNGLEFERFEPSKPVRKDYYSEIPVKVEVQGGFHQVAFFLSKVGSMDRILHISVLNMGKYSADDGGKLQASMQATTYKYEATPMPTIEKAKGKKSDKK